MGICEERERACRLAAREEQGRRLTGRVKARLQRRGNLPKSLGLEPPECASCVDCIAMRKEGSRREPKMKKNENSQGEGRRKTQEAA